MKGGRLRERERESGNDIPLIKSDSISNAGKKKKVIDGENEKFRSIRKTLNPQIPPKYENFQSY